MSEKNWRRRYYRIFIQPRAQFKLFAPFFVFMASWTAVILLVSYVFKGMLDQVSGPAQSLSADQITKLQVLSHVMFKTVVWGSFAAVALSFLFWLSFSHSVFGPIVQIHRQIKRLKNGELDKKIHLRAHDEFHNVADSLNELTDELKSRAG
jgi:nitrate/nitrite-specific signal transduction histidine kinase